MKQACLLLIAIALFSSSCSDSGTKSKVDPEPTEVLLPLAIGNTWIYEFHSYNEAGDMLTFSVDTLLVEYSTPDGFEFDNVAATMFLPEFNYSRWHNTDKGLHLKHKAYYDFEGLVYPYPAENDYSYIVEIDTGKRQIEIKLFKDVEVTIGLSTFECYKYESRLIILGEGYSDYKYIHYFVPGMGLVKTERMKIAISARYFYLEGLHRLTEYKLN